MRLRLTAALVTLTAAWLVAAAAPETLADRIRAMGVDSAGVAPASLGEHIVGAASLTTTGLRAIAYFVDAGDGTIRSPLRVLVRAGGAPWQAAAITRIGTFDQQFGGARAIHASASLLFIDTDMGVSPSLVVLRRKDLTTAATLNGTFVTALPSELAVYLKGAGHGRADVAEIDTFDVKTTRDRTLYPTSASSLLRQAYLAKLRALVPRGGAPGQTPAAPSYALSIAGSSVLFDAGHDTLTFQATLSALGLPASVKADPQTIAVACRPMKAAAPACTESAPHGR